jgi:aryl-alcohol dehydrogenase-like predicted oxidoreductase
LLPYFPLASGMLTGKYSRLGGKPAGRLTDNFLRLGDTFMTERNFEIVEDLEAFAKERGRTLLGLAISWLLANPLVSSVICGATKPEQVEQNIMASGWAMTSEDLARIDQITGLR